MPTEPPALAPLLLPPVGAQSTPVMPTEPPLADEEEPELPEVPELLEPLEPPIAPELSDAPELPEAPALPDVPELSVVLELPDAPLEPLMVPVLEEGRSVLLPELVTPDWLDASIPGDAVEVDEDCAYASPDAVNNTKNKGDKRDIISPSQ